MARITFQDMTETEDELDLGDEGIYVNVKSNRGNTDKPNLLWATHGYVDTKSPNWTYTLTALTYISKIDSTTAMEWLADIQYNITTNYLGFGQLRWYSDDDELNPAITYENVRLDSVDPTEPPEQSQGDFCYLTWTFSTSELPET